MEAEQLANVLEVRRKAIEVRKFERWLTDLEKAQKKDAEEARTPVEEEHAA